MQHPEFVAEPTSDTNAVSYSARGTRYGDVVRTSYRAITTDRVKNSGGKGQGVTSTGLFVSALAASSSQAVHEAAKGMKLEDIRSEMTHRGNGAFTREATLGGDLSGTERRTLLEAARTSLIDGFLGATP